MFISQRSQSRGYLLPPSLSNSEKPTSTAQSEKGWPFLNPCFLSTVELVSRLRGGALSDKQDSSQTEGRPRKKNPNVKSWCGLCTHPTSTRHCEKYPSQRASPSYLTPSLSMPWWKQTYCFSLQTSPQQHDECGLSHVLLGRQALLPPLDTQILNGALEFLFRFR